MRASKEARIHQRWREQAARLIALACWPELAQAFCGRCFGDGQEGADDDGIAPDDAPCPACDGRGDALGARIVELLNGEAYFDVAKMRERAERLIAEGERLERERVVFTDWTRTRGLGPETFRFIDHHGVPDEQRDCDEDCECPYCTQEGGWPGPLAREWGTVRCSWCVADCPVSRRDCTVCKGRGYVKHPRREAAAANGGAWMVRAGRRLLAALEGQSSECQRCKDVEASKLVSCGVCRGTGHNLAGMLPAFVFPRETNDAHVLAYHTHRYAE